MSGSGWRAFHSQLMLHQVVEAPFVSRHEPIAWLSSKNFMNAGRGST
jgi:hypothetical protein